MDPTAAFLVTTARSGTQWLAAALSEVYPDLPDVDHEPVGCAYAPCRTLRDADALAALAAESAIRAHLDRVHTTLGEGRSYVESGFPAFAIAPLAARAFGDRLRHVQLVRDPVRVAALLVTHMWYGQRARADVQGTVAMTPFCPGVRLHGYRARWERMSAFEKGLCYWAEVHLYGLELEAAAPTDRFARFRTEDLVADDPTERRRLCAFLDLPERATWLAAPARQVDGHRHTTTEPIDPRELERHPEIVALAERFGYRAGTDADTAQALSARYRAGRIAAFALRARRALRRTVGRLRP